MELALGRAQLDEAIAAHGGGGLQLDEQRTCVVCYDDFSFYSDGVSCDGKESHFLCNVRRTVASSCPLPLLANSSASFSWPSHIRRRSVRPQTSSVALFCCLGPVKPHRRASQAGFARRPLCVPLSHLPTDARQLRRAVLR